MIELKKGPMILWEKCKSTNYLEEDIVLVVISSLKDISIMLKLIQPKYFLVKVEEKFHGLLKSK